MFIEELRVGSDFLEREEQEGEIGLFFLNLRGKSERILETRKLGVKAQARSKGKRPQGQWRSS